MTPHITASYGRAGTVAELRAVVPHAQGPGDVDARGRLHVPGPRAGACVLRCSMRFVWWFHVVSGVQTGLLRCFIMFLDDVRGLQCVFERALRCRRTSSRSMCSGAQCVSNGVLGRLGYCSRVFTAFLTQAPVPTDIGATSAPPPLQTPEAEGVQTVQGYLLSPRQEAAGCFARFWRGGPPSNLGLHGAVLPTAVTVRSIRRRVGRPGSSRGTPAPPASAR